MFIGSISQGVRSIIAEMATDWIGLPIFCGCSGNFTIERILNKSGIVDIHSNDVSLYSCYIGSYLTGKNIEVEIADNNFFWLKRYMQPGIPMIATLLLAMEFFKYIDRVEPYHKRMLQAYMSRFDNLHTSTVEKVTRVINGIKLKSFYTGDVMDFIQEAPDRAVALSFPPTYKKGYERLYKKIDQVFYWKKPNYIIFDDHRLESFIQELTKKQIWMICKDHNIQALDEYFVGLVQTGQRTMPTFVYSNSGHKRLIQSKQKIEKVFIERQNEYIQGPLSIIKLTQGQMNSLRSQYLSMDIVPTGAPVNLGVVSGDKLIGCLGFAKSNFSWCDAYMLSDFAINSSRYKRLSKLILAVALSWEIKIILEQYLRTPINTIGTTAFTKKPVSMKYRGMFDLVTRKKEQLNYRALAGCWDLKEGFKWWMNKHSEVLK